MKVTCPSCHNEVSVADINMDQMMARCLPCNELFDCRQIANLHTPRAQIELPKGIDIDTSSSELHIKRKWFGLTAIGLTIFCVFWDGFMVVWFGIAISQGEWLMAAFGSIHGLVGIGITYVCIAMYVNTTTIHVAWSELTIRHAPLPWRGNRTLNPRDIQQFFVKERIHRNKNGTRSTYELHALSQSGDDHKLVTGLSSSQQALYLEQQIESYLRLRDVPIEGELHR